MGTGKSRRIANPRVDLARPRTPDSQNKSFPESTYILLPNPPSTALFTQLFPCPHILRHFVFPLLSASCSARLLMASVHGPQVPRHPSPFRRPVYKPTSKPVHSSASHSQVRRMLTHRAF